VSRLFAGVPLSFSGAYHPNHPCFSPLPLPHFFRRLRRHLSLASLVLHAYLCLSSGDDHGRGHGKRPCDAIGAILKRHASTRFDIGASSRRELQSDYWPSAVDKCIVERYRELANQLRNRSAAAATLPDLVPCLSSSSDSSEEEEEFEYETQGMYWRHLDADA
jgi:hypothetical protein